MTAQPTEATEELRAARDFLLEHRDDYDGGRRGIPSGRGPGASTGALEWFDVIARNTPTGTALVIVEEDGPAGPGPTQSCRPGRIRSPGGCRRTACGAATA